MRHTHVSRPALRGRVVLVLGHHPDLARLGRIAITTAAQAWGWTLRGPGLSEAAMVARDWRACGVIGNLNIRNHARSLRGLGIPLVHIGADPSPVPVEAWIRLDRAAAGRLAITRLLAAGHRSIAILTRGAAVADDAASWARSSGISGIEVRRLELATLGPAGDRRLASWLRRLPIPTAVLASDDAISYRVVQVAVRLGLKIPERLSVVGIGDSDHCLFSMPTLSSVDPDAAQAGQRAVAALAQLLASRTTRGAVIAPRGLVERASTMLVPVRDLLVSDVLKQIYAGRGRLPDLVRLAAAAGISRRTLERRFRRSVGRSPLQAWQAYRVEAAQRQLNADGDGDLSAIARGCGFASADHLSVTLRRHLGAGARVLRGKRNPVKAQSTRR